jgi:hypothetical protein
MKMKMKMKMAAPGANTTSGPVQVLGALTERLGKDCQNMAFAGYLITNYMSGPCTYLGWATSSSRAASLEAYMSQRVRCRRMLGPSLYIAPRISAAAVPYLCRLDIKRQRQRRRGPSAQLRSRWPIPTERFDMEQAGI